MRRLAAHGMMHMVITNAAKKDPYGIDVLFMYMANMSWNSAMNVPDTIKYLTQKEPDGSYTIPKIIYSDAYASEMVQYADLILPDTTYLERWDCISLLDRPISEADGPADSIRQPVVEPERDVRPFQTVLLDLGNRIGLPGMTRTDGSPRYPGGYADYIVNHERAPGIGPLAGFRGPNGRVAGQGHAEPRAAAALHRQWLPLVLRTSRSHEVLPPCELGLSRLGHLLRLHRQAGARHPPALLRTAAEVPPCRAGPRQGSFRLRSIASASPAYFDPIPFWYPPFEGEMVSETEFPMHAVTQRPMAMYHSWGSQNAWLRQILGRNWLYMAREMAAKLRISDGDWVTVTSHHGKIKAQAKLMDGVNPETVWTWNAIGKRSGAWNLEPGADEVEEGLPAQPPDLRAPARTRGRLPLFQQRSRHRPGRLV